jgi:hypothetical protein
MRVFLANAEPSLLLSDRLMTHRTDFGQRTFTFPVLDFQTHYANTTSGAVNTNSRTAPADAIHRSPRANPRFSHTQNLKRARCMMTPPRMPAATQYLLCVPRRRLMRCWIGNRTSSFVRGRQRGTVHKPTCAASLPAEMRHRISASDSSSYEEGFLCAPGNCVCCCFITTVFSC